MDIVTQSFNTKLDELLAVGLYLLVNDAPVGRAHTANLLNFGIRREVLSFDCKLVNLMAV